MNWSDVEKIVGECIPTCVKTILSTCGYNTRMSLQNISLQSLLKIEEHINKYSRGVIQTLNCCNAEIYKQQNVFKLLPGHVDLLIEIPKILTQKHGKKFGITFTPKCKEFDLLEAIENSGLSVILKEMVKTALQNEKYDKKM